jgi:hypothetical protein
VPVTEKALGATDAWRGIVARGAPADVTLADGVVPVVNAGQAGYFRTLYAPELMGAIAANFRKLDPTDQIGVANDAAALGYAGLEPLSDFLSLTAQASPDMDPQALEVLVDQLDGLTQLYRGLPGEAAMNAFVQKRLEPVAAVLGWDIKAGENQNVTLLRNGVLGALSNASDPATIAEANRRFAGFVTDPTSLSGDLRRNVLHIIAAHADAAIWEQIHTLAKTTADSLQKQIYYGLLSQSRDPALAQKALDLAMTDEAPVTLRPAMIATVSRLHPEMAVDFAIAHIDAINVALEPDSRTEYVPRLARSSHDPAMIAKLDAYADAHIPASARQNVVKADSAIAYGVKIRKDRLPDVDRWLAAH